MKLERLRTLHMENPLGIDEDPFFSWILKSDRKNVFQTGFRICVKDAEGELFWDSGFRQDDRNAFIPYEGKALRSRTKYVWEVTVQNNYGENASAGAVFETALRDRSEWKGTFVEAPAPTKQRAAGFGNQPPATLFRRVFSVPEDKEIAEGRIWCTARGVYRLYVNGTRTDGRELAPGYASYDKIFPYQTYDVTAELQSGKNALGMYVGDGWYFNQETAIHKQETAEAPHAVLYELRIRYTDGTEEYFCSDGSEKTSDGPVRFSDLFAGGQYDARCEKEGWSSPDFDDAGWQQAKALSDPLPGLIAAPDDRIVSVAQLPVQKLYESPAGELIADFGQNMAGRVRVQTALPEGTKLVLEHFEVTDPDGNYFNTIYATNGVGAGADQKTEFISGGKPAVYEPYFTYFGFRYVRIRFFDADGQELTGDVRPAVSADQLCASALSTSRQDLGDFACSDERLNRLYSNIRWSQTSNMISVPTDCPQREKAGWTGDAGIYIGTALLNEDVTPFFTRWLRSMEADQQEDGLVPMVVPFNETYRSMSRMMAQMTGTEGYVTSAGWGDACVMIPWTMYQVTGNRQILASSYGMMKRWCEYILRNARTCGRPDLPAEKECWLWDSGFHYGEWLIPSTSRGGFDDQQAIGMAMAMTAGYVAPIFGYISVSTFARIAQILGRGEDAEHYADIAGKMKDAVMSCLIGPDGKAPAEYMGAYVLLLYFDLVPEKWRRTCEERLTEMIRENSGCLDTGFLATPYLLETLEKTGHLTEAFDLLFQTKCPSWLYEVEQGATTIWETWNAVGADGKPQHVSMNHYSFGCVAQWMFRTIGGIGSDEPGYRHVVIAPKTDPRIDWARRSYESEQGTVSCSWKRTESGVEMTVEIPCNTKATVILPDGRKEEVGSGIYHF
ncbi:MAG: family 78 glycoside hydrolase catalytic domain [Lachnospiraceae bacterium]|nr:family 78 glycoside hydrolase catalytic domain [Lachnospiraceae bacterium]